MHQHADFQQKSMKNGAVIIINACICPSLTNQSLFYLTSVPFCLIRVNNFFKFTDRFHSYLQSNTLFLKHAIPC